MAQLKVFKDNGQLLFDTALITHGLIKSGYMTYLQSWTRRELRSAQLDPNDGSNWFPSVANSSESYADSLHGFTVYNAQSPIVFITGSGCLNGSSVSGNATTFFYSNADANTKFYCFDLMADNIPGSPYFKTFNLSGRITFNSLQPPLNVVGGVQAPGPGAVDQYGRYLTCYSGGANRTRQAQGVVNGVVNRGKVDSYVNIPLLAGVEYAAYLPWSRSVGYADFMSGGSSNFRMYSGGEGAYGYYGGITFMFGASAGTNESKPFNQGYSIPISFFNLPTDRYPVALFIKTSDLPFPYN